MRVKLPPKEDDKADFSSKSTSLAGIEDQIVANLVVLVPTPNFHISFPTDGTPQFLWKLNRSYYKILVGALLSNWVWVNTTTVHS